MPICFGASNFATSFLYFTPGCGWGYFIVSDYCISVTERKLINVTSFRCVSEILRLDNVFVILELYEGIESERVLVQAIIF